ncbi:MAG: glycosyltransferase [Alphaproteobacteria bacterium]|nr:glycosyltransferase [Alphaproteobacteria bacterium]
MSEADVSTPRVSVVIAAYNVESYIGRAIASVRAQSMASHEILVADDGSSDGTCRMVEELALRDASVRLLRTSANAGAGAARNRAIAAARGEWVAVLDADDTWKPWRLERLLSAATARNCVIAADNYVQVDDATGREVGVAFHDSRPESAITALRFIQSERPLGRVRFGLLKPVVRRDFLEKHGIRYPVGIYAEDFHFFMQVLLAGGQGVLLSEPGYLYTLPESPANGARSLGTRTNARLSDRIWIADDLMEKFGACMSPQDRQAILQYRRWMQDIADGSQARELWRRGDHLRAIGAALASSRGAFSYAVTSPTVKRWRARLSPRAVRPPL